MAVELLLPETAVAISDHVVITVCFAAVCTAVFPKKEIPRVQSAVLKCAIISKLFHVRATLANELLLRELCSCVRRRNDQVCKSQYNNKRSFKNKGCSLQLL